MNDRIWAKVVKIEEHAASMQSDLARLKAEARFSVGPTAVAQTGGELVKEQLFELSTRLDDLQVNQEAMQSQVVVQQELAHKLLEAQEYMKAETKEELQELHAEFAATIQEETEKIQGLVTEKIQGQVTEKIQGQVMDKLRTESEQHSADSDKIQQSLVQLRDELSNQMAQFQEAHGAMEVAANECSEAILQVQHDTQNVLEALEPRLARCEARWDEEGSEILQQLPEAMSTIKELRSELGECLCKVEQNEADLKKVSGHQTQLQDLHGQIQEEVSHLGETARNVDALEDDLAEHRKSTSTIYKEVESLLEATGDLREKLREGEVRGQETRQDLEELRRKEGQQGERLLAAEQALPNLERNLCGRTKTLEDSLGDARASVDMVTSRMQRLASELAQGLAEERSRARADCDAAVDRWQSEARPRLDNLDCWRGAVEHQQAAINERCAANEHRYSLQDQRLTSHDDLLHRLAERCQEIPRLLEARVDEVRAEAKDGLTASTLTAFQGEMALMAKIAQLTGAGGPAPGPQPMPHAQPGLVFDGQHWRHASQARSPLIGPGGAGGFPFSIA